MLSHKNRINHKTNIPQPEFHRVPRQATPIVLQTRVDQELRNGEDAPNKVHEDLLDGPADGGAAAVVCVDLRDEFYECDEEFHIAYCVDHVDPRPGRRVSSSISALRPYQAHYPQDSDHAPRSDAKHASRYLASAALIEAPGPFPEHCVCQEAEEHGVCRECHIVGPDGRFRRDGVARCILRADKRGEVEGACGDKVGYKPQDVYDGKGDGGADGRLPANVEDGLWVEG